VSSPNQTERPEDGVRWFLVDVTSFELVDPIAFESDLDVAFDRLERCWADGVPAVLARVQPDTPTGSFEVFAAVNIEKSKVQQDRGLMEAIGRAIWLPLPPNSR
jgi:hypothetical protein